VRVRRSSAHLAIAWRDAHARIFDREHRAAAGPARRHADPPVERELERVRQEIQDDLFPHRAIDVDRLRQRRAVDLERQSAAFDRRTERAREIGRETREVDRLVDGVGASRFDAGKVEERVDQFEQPQLVAVDRLELLASHRPTRRVPVGAAVVMVAVVVVVVVVIVMMMVVAVVDNDDRVRGGEPAAQYWLERQRIAVERHPGDDRSNRMRVGSGIHQRAHGHVAGRAGKAVEPRRTRHAASFRPSSSGRWRTPRRNRCRCRPP